MACWNTTDSRRLGHKQRSPPILRWGRNASGRWWAGLRLLNDPGRPRRRFCLCRTARTFCGHHELGDREHLTGDLKHYLGQPHPTPLRPTGQTQLAHVAHGLSGTSFGADLNQTEVADRRAAKKSARTRTNGTFLCGFLSRSSIQSHLYRAAEFRSDGRWALRQEDVGHHRSLRSGLCRGEKRRERVSR